jgi:hypothetical protein
MTDEFTIESRTVEAITVRHVAHGHRYVFHVSEAPHRRLLCVGPVQTSGKTSLPRSASRGRLASSPNARRGSANLIY